MKAFYTLILGLCAVGIFSCSKSNELPKGDNNLLTQHKWRLSSIKLIGSDSSETSTEIPKCREDDLREYETTGKFILHTGSYLCKELEKTKVGTWQLRDYNKTLHMYVETVGYYDEQVLELSENALIIRYQVLGTDNSVEEAYAPAY